MTEDLLARLLLLHLPKMGPVRSRWLLESSEPVEVVEQLRRGRLPVDVRPAPVGVNPQLVAEWIQRVRSLDPAELRERHGELGINLLAPDDHRWPLGDDPEPPLLLFYMGDLDLLRVPLAMGVVGTRRCTSVGRTVAFGIGRDLAAAGVAIVSGLALGVDGAAHRGTLEARGAAIGVVGSGLDVIYPGGNRQLWGDVSTDGLLVSEAPAGARPQRWRFPARNRLIAGLSDGLIIVESHSRGGALLTVDETVDRGKPVFAVPGSVLSAASDGTNGLLVEGATPVRNAVDVLAHLGLIVEERREPRDAMAATPQDAAPEASTERDTSGAREAEGPASANAAGEALAGQGPDGSADGAPAPSVRSEVLTELEELILAEAATGPVHIDALVHSTDASVLDVTAAVQRLEALSRVLLDGSTVSLIL